jgi:hypothetical protein
VIRARHGEGMLEMGDQLSCDMMRGRQAHMEWAGRKECLGGGGEEEGMFEVQWRR